MPGRLPESKGATSRRPPWPVKFVRDEISAPARAILEFSTASDTRVNTVRDTVLIPRRERPSVSQSHQIVDLAFTPAVILDRERIDARIDADIANEEIGTLDQMCHLVFASLAETTHGA
jgi:hypothetical protein